VGRTGDIGVNGDGHSALRIHRSIDERPARRNSPTPQSGTLALTLIPLPHEDAANSQDGPRSAGAAHGALRGLVDGAIVHSLPDNHPALMTLRALNMPMVIVDAQELRGSNDRRYPRQDRQPARKGATCSSSATNVSASSFDVSAPTSCAVEPTPSRWSNSPERVVRERIEGYRHGLRGSWPPLDAVPLSKSAHSIPLRVPIVHRPDQERQDHRRCRKPPTRMAIGVFEAAKTLDPSHIPPPYSHRIRRRARSRSLGLTTIRQPMI